MNVFLAGIIQGSIAEAKIHSQDWREPIMSALARHLPDADVYCHFSRHPNSITYELPDICQTLADGSDRAGARDLLIAYVPSASMGTAIEMFQASGNGAAVVTISPLAANWVIRAYSDVILPDIDSFEAFLASGKLDELIKAKQKQ